MRPVELCGDAPNGGGPGLAARGPRMEVVQPDAEGFAPLQVVDKTGVGLRRLVLVGLGEVDEVGAVREGVLGGAVAVGFAVADELVLGIGGDGGVVPFALGFEEEGE